ncbi:hypothetical protein [Lachnobacterium bovis]|uniref:Uncharacterized protein n=1 Tax=Lachnobacterium bovis TaxID=140626 RepID=A0A1H9U4J3_9FIRM|nr:hypothetical protein [Lachnobacterium bovis]SES04158.1 hypothetical protein SAMN02910429_01917 [Lachnobacterium bovis]
MNKISKKLIALGGASILSISMLVTPANTVKASGTERPWSLALPHNYGNHYFPFRKKQTNETSGYIILKSCDSQKGANAWFCSGTGLSSAVRCSSIARMRKPGKYLITYNKNSNAGSSVDMAIENASRTLIRRDHASGIVNYK